MKIKSQELREFIKTMLKSDSTKRPCANTLFKNKMLSKYYSVKDILSEECKSPFVSKFTYHPLPEFKAENIHNFGLFKEK